MVSLVANVNDRLCIMCVLSRRWIGITGPGMGRNRHTYVSVLMLLTCGLAACSSTPDVTFRESSQPRVATRYCTADVRLTDEHNGEGSLMVKDRRGVEAELPADPPGQRERYGKTGFALVFEGRDASWFISGLQPVDCRRKIQ